MGERHQRLTTWPTAAVLAHNVGDVGSRNVAGIPCARGNVLSAHSMSDVT